MLKSKTKTILARSNTKKFFLVFLLLLLTVGIFADTSIIPGEVKTTFETARDWVKNELATVILGLFWICSCVAYGFNKDSNRAKIAFIAVSIACIGVGLGPKIVENFVGMGGN